MCAVWLGFTATCGFEMITTAVGGGAITADDGVPGTSAALSSPDGIAAWYNASSGRVRLWIANSGTHRLLAVNEEGIVSRVGGNAAGTAGVPVEGVSALLSPLSSPFGIAVAHNPATDRFTLWVADSGNNRIRRINEDGTIVSVAGNGTMGYAQDGVPATSTPLNRPDGVCVTFANASALPRLWIVDTSNQRVRLVDEMGIISTVAGNGTAGFFGDGGPAINGLFNGPYGLSAWVNTTRTDAGVILWVADKTNHRIRRIDEAGIITTVAGNGTQGYCGDGGLATLGCINRPDMVANHYNSLTQRHTLYITDTTNNRLRRVDEAGMLSTVTGTGAATWTGDGGLAAAATIFKPWDVALHYNESAHSMVMWLTDAGNHRVRRIWDDGVSATPSTTPTPSATSSQTSTPSCTASATPTSTNSPSITPSPSSTSSSSPSSSRTASSSSSATPTMSGTPSRTASITGSLTPSSSCTASGTPTPSHTASRTRSMTPTSSVSPTATSSQTGTPSPSPLVVYSAPDAALPVRFIIAV